MSLKVQEPELLCNVYKIAQVRSAQNDKKRRKTLKTPTNQFDHYRDAKVSSIKCSSNNT